jgi:hypothetical protein
MNNKDRIHRLKKELEPLACGKVEAWISDALPPDAAEQFCRDVVAFETAPTTTNFQQLTEAGITLPAPDHVSDAAMATTLWVVIEGLAHLGVFLNWTDHLSDRELYSVLWKDVLREEIPILPKGSQGAWHVDLPGGDADSRQYLKFYADDDDRRHWQKEFPDYEMPAHEDPPYDRDRHLPVPFDQPRGLRH